jgi:hypothetical protein
MGSISGPIGKLFDKLPTWAKDAAEGGIAPILSPSTEHGALMVASVLNEEIIAAGAAKKTPAK